MLKFVFIRIVLPLLLFLVLRYVFKSLSGGMKSVSRPAAPGARRGGELKKDPVCGTYVSAESAVTRTVGSETLHFCSPACRDKYRA